MILPVIASKLHGTCIDASSVRLNAITPSTHSIPKESMNALAKSRHTNERISDMGTLKGIFISGIKNIPCRTEPLQSPDMGALTCRPTKCLRDSNP